MKRLTKEIQLVNKVDAQQARTIAGGFIFFLQQKIAAGESVDLGFIKLKAATTKPATHVVKFAGKATTFLTGQSKRWWVVIRRSWLKKVQPMWSRFHG